METKNLTYNSIPLAQGATYTCWWDKNGFYEEFVKPLSDGESGVNTIRITDIDFETKTVTFKKV